MGEMKTHNTELIASMQIGEAPPFYQLDEYVFQEMCAALLAREPGISLSEIYGERGQKQDGIDVLAWHNENSVTVTYVGQCKCYKDFQPQQIEKATDEFFDYWESRWKNENIKKFILFVASEFKTVQRMNAVNEQRRRFQEKGIIYEPWSAKKIREKLRPHPDIIRTYIKEDTETWVRKICGEAVSLPTGMSGGNTDDQLVGIRGLTQQVDFLEARLSSDIEQHYHQALSALKEGRSDDAVVLIKRTQNDAATWNVLTPQQKSQLLQLEALLEMPLPGGLHRASALVDQAQALIPGENLVRLRTLIAFYQNGPQAALTLLEGLTDLESINLRAAILLENHQVAESLAVLKTVLPTSPQTVEEKVDYAESFRVQALAYLADQQLDLARLAIGKALELAPKWMGVRYAAAMIDYYSVLAPAGRPAYLELWPSPVEWDFVQRDDASLERLRAAAGTFNTLNHDNRGIDNKVVNPFIPIWYLACLANDPDKQEEAIAYCRLNLQKDPANSAAIMWTIARRFDIGLEHSADTIKALINNGTANILHVTALVYYFLATNKPEEAARLLEEQRSLYFNSNNTNETNWIVLYNQVSIAQGKTEQIIEIPNLNGSESVGRHSRARMLEYLARKTKDWQPLLAYLDESYTATSDVEFLLDACKIQASLGNWAYVAEHADALLTDLQTVVTIRLVIDATYTTHQYDRCLAFMDNHVHLFSRSTLPSDLRIVRAICLRGFGVISEAIMEAEAVAHNDPSPSNLLTLAHLYYDKGDLWSLASIARKLLASANLSAVDALRLAEQLKTNDREVAINLWRYAVNQDSSDENASAAVGLGFTLGLDKELGPLMERLTELAKDGKSGVQLIELKSLVDMMESLRIQAEELKNHYFAGLYPIHMVSERLRWLLPFIYHKTLADNAATSDPTHQFAVLIRYGGHTLPHLVTDQKPQGRLIADVTSILLAAHLNVLDYVERLFAPIYVADSLIPTLLHLQNQLQPHQSSRIEEFKIVLNLCKRGAIHVTDLTNMESLVQVFRAEHGNIADDLGEDRVSLLTKAVSVNGYIVDFIPLPSRFLERQSINLPKEFESRVVNCRTVVEALRENGALAEQDYRQALADLGSLGNEPFIREVPPIGAKLYLSREVALLLAGATILSKLCDKYEVNIEQALMDEAQQTVDQTTVFTELVDWLAALRHHISTGLDIENRKYALLPTRIRIPTEEQRAETVVEAELLTIMSVQTQPGDRIWVDDRFITSYSSQGVAPIIGINEILKFLLGTSTITQDVYFEKLYQLKAGNARFLPLQPDEIIYHLHQAPIRDGKILETPQLGVLRRYSAACQLPEQPALQRPGKIEIPQERNPLGEVPFLLAMQHTILETINTLWLDPDLNRAEIYSMWVLKNLYNERVDPYRIEAQPSSMEIEKNVLANRIATLLLNLMHSRFGENGVREERARRFSQWVWDQVLEPRSLSEPHLVTVVANVLKEVVVNMLDEIQDSENVGLNQGARRSTPNTDPTFKANLAFFIAINRFRLELPEAIRQEWDRDSVFLARIGVITSSVTTIEDISFNSVSFNKAVNKALRGIASTVLSLEKKRIKINPHFTDGRIHEIWFFHPTTRKRIALDTNENALGILADFISERENWLSRRREWFDTDATTFNKVVAEIAADTNLSRRVEAVNVWLKSNNARFYQNLGNQLDKNENLRQVDLINVSVNGFTQHFRLPVTTPPSEGFVIALIEATRLLIQECGIFEALRRLCGFPVPLPQLIFDTLKTLSINERRNVIHTLLRTEESPLTSIHLLRILLAFKDDNLAYERLARRIVVRFTSKEGGAEFEAFRRLLCWVDITFSQWQGSSTAPTHLKLAFVWSHASRLYSVFRIHKIPFDWIPDELRPAHLEVAATILAAENDYSRDIVYPFRLSRASFLLAAFQYGIGDANDTFVDEALRNRVVGATFFAIEDNIYPEIDLLYDTTNLVDNLHSFLGKNNKEYTSLLGKEMGAILQSENIETELMKVMTNLKSNALSAQEWSFLDVILSDLSPSPAILETFTDLIGRVNFKDLFVADLETGVIAMQTAARRTFYLQPEAVHIHMENQLLEIASFLSNRWEQPDLTGTPPSAWNGWSNDSLSIYLPNWAYYLARNTEGGEERANKFAELLGELVNRWPLLIEKCADISRTLAMTLPFSLAIPFWGLLIRLRAKKK